MLRKASALEAMTQTTNQSITQSLNGSVSEASRPHIALQKCFSFPVLLGAVLVGTNFLVHLSLRVEPDTWWHIRYGEEILSTGKWPAVDTWSFTVSGFPRLAYEWGGEVVMALSERLGGLRGLHVLGMALTTAVLLLVYYYAWLRSRKSKAAFLATLLIVPLASLSFTVRPQLLGYIFLLTTLICLERFRTGTKKNLWMLPPLFLVWVNTHSSFSLGFLVLGIYWASGLVSFECGGVRAELWRPAQRLHLELVCLLSLLVLPITPYGSRLATVPFDVASSLPLNFARVREWEPIDFGLWQAKLLLVLILAFLVAQVILRPTYRLEELALFVFASYSAFVHVRFVILFALIIAPLAAGLIARWVSAYKPAVDKFALNAALILLAAVAIATHFPSRTELDREVAGSYPVKAVGYLRRHPLPGPTFNDYGWGGYLIWKLGADRRVFIDGRGDVYEYAGVFSDWARIADVTPEALARLRAYSVRSCLIGSRSPLATVLALRPEWKRVYRDELSAVFFRW
jgi:hypothetical protein